MNLRKITCFLISLSILTASYSQKGIINKGALIVVANNGIINLNGAGAAYINQSNGSNHGRITLDGKIYVDGNWTNNATSGSVLLNPGNNGEVILDGPSAQTIGGTAPTSFEKLTVNNTAGISLQSNVSLFGNLGLTAGKLNTGSNILTLSSGTAITGTPSANNMIIASGSGEVRKLFTGPASFTFPVGDNTGTAEYSPATLNFSSGTFGAGAYASVKLANVKHPSNTSSASYLNRYWTVSQYNISNFNCTVSLNYVDADIVGTESALYLGQFTNPFWTKLNATNAPANMLTGTVSSFSDFTGGQSSAFDVSFTMANQAVINESAENGSVINVTLFNAWFQPSLNPANWILSNLPQGVSLGSLSRTDNTHASITLSGSRTKDYDANITNTSLSIGYQDLLNLPSGSVSASSGVTFTANNDPESLLLSGTATEHSEDGAIVTITLVGGTFAGILTPSNWTLTNLPAGVTKGTITRVSSTVATIALVGNSTGADPYTSDITNLTLMILKAEVDDNSDIVTSLSVNTGFTFINVDESLTITMAGTLNESAENVGIITVKIKGKNFVPTLIPANWTLTNLPQGVTKGTITRTSDTTATIALNGTRTKDYDNNITNLMLQIKAAEFVSQSTDAVISTGITFVANNDAESLAMSAGTITEGSENGQIINVTLVGGTFASPLTLANWSFTNLPPGVTIGSVSRTNATHAVITLSGNHTRDYDSNINLNLSVNEIEIDDYTSIPLTCSTGAVLTAVNDAEVLTMSDAGNIVEGSENGKVITVNLSGGTFANPITPANWILTKMPAGITIGNITRNSSTQVAITLSGNATVDYDSDITNVTLTVKDPEIDDNNTDLTISTGVVFHAIDEPVTISLSDSGINESSENGRKIFVKLSQDRFINSPSLANWVITNLPVGVTVGGITLVDSIHVTLTLSGNRTKDYDANITNTTVLVKGNQFKQHNYDVSANTGVTFVALNDAESLTMSDDGNITEGAEDGEKITVNLTGGTFIPVLNPANWSISGQPAGVTIGNVVLASSTQATITLSGNRTVNYNNDITNMQLSVNEAEVDDYTGPPLTVNTGVTFKAVLETLSITASDSGKITEGSENDKQIIVTLTGGTFISTLDLANWTVVNLPAGVSKGSISRISSTQASVTLTGNRISDYDADITNVSVHVANSEFAAYAGADLYTSGGITFKANNEQLSISNPGLIETNLNGAVISMNLINETFADNLLNPLNFSLNNAPAGTSISSIGYIDPAHANLTLAYDSVNYDFDVNIPDFSITIGKAELAGVAPVTSNNLLITAVVENVQAVLADSNLVENTLNNAAITIKLINERFRDASLIQSNFVLNAPPAGLSIGNVTWLGPDMAKIILSFDGTDFDDDINNFSVTILGNELRGNQDVTTNKVPIHAIVEIPQLTISSGKLIEPTLNGFVISLTLVNEKFANQVLDKAGFVLNNVPNGLTVGSVSYIDTLHAELTLTFDSTDFDADSTHCTLTIKADQLAGNADLTSNPLTIEAVIEPAEMIISGNLNEKYLNEDSLTIELKNVVFTDGILDKNNFRLNNAPAGTTIDTVIYVGPSDAIMKLAYDNTDFDINVTDFSITLSSIELEGLQVAELSSNTLTITAVIELQTATISHAGLTETNLNGAIIMLDLQNDTFVKPIPVSKDFILNNVPPGTSLDTVILISNIQAQIKLKFNGLDFDQDYANFNVTIAAGEVAGNRSIITNSLSITAIIEIETVTISHPGLSKQNLNGAKIQLDLSGVKFTDNRLSATNFILNNAPAGTTVDSVVYISDTKADIYLGYDGTNFTTDISNFNITVMADELTGLSNLTSNSLSILATGIDLKPDEISIHVHSYENVIYIRCEQFDQLTGNVAVYDVSGKEVARRKLMQAPLNKITLQGTPGDYIVRIYNKNKVYTAKVFLMSE